jgi:hypothetical protein
MISHGQDCTRENKESVSHGRKSNVSPHTDLVTGNISEDPISIASTGTTFTTTTKDNVQNLYHQNLEKDARIKELEEQLKQVKIDERNLQSFKASAFFLGRN